MLKHTLLQIESLEAGLVTVPEAAKFLSVSRTTIYKLMDTGALQYVKLLRARRIPWKALTRLAGENLVGGRR